MTPGARVTPSSPYTVDQTRYSDGWSASVHAATAAAAAATAAAAAAGVVRQLWLRLVRLSGRGSNAGVVAGRLPPPPPPPPAAGGQLRPLLWGG